MLTVPVHCAWSAAVVVTVFCERVAQSLSSFEYLGMADRWLNLRSGVSTQAGGSALRSKSVWGVIHV